MARYDFGGTVPDFIFTTGTVGGINDVMKVPTATTITFWTAITGGTQHTDLTLNGAPVTSISATRGVLPDFKGPDGVTTMFASAGGTRVRLVTWTNAATPGGGSSTAPDATTSTKGIIQLAGDLGGSAAAPTVPALANKAAGVHTHPVSQLSDLTLAALRTFLQANSIANARAAIGAGVDTLMTLTEANAGTDTTARQISPSVLRGAILATAGSGPTGSVTYAQLPAGSTLTYDFARGGFGASAGALPSSRPTTRTDITIVWTVPIGTDVTSVALAGDKVDYY